MWHCDGYDKLKLYGFPIHGCIDGLARSKKKGFQQIFKEVSVAESRNIK